MVKQSIEFPDRTTIPVWYNDRMLPDEISSDTELCCKNVDQILGTIPMSHYLVVVISMKL